MKPCMAVAALLAAAGLHRSDQYVNIGLRRQLAKNVNVCDNLSIFESGVPCSTQRRPFIVFLWWITAQSLIVHVASKIKLHFPVAIMQVRNESGVPDGKWIAENVPNTGYADCPEEKNTLFTKDNTNWLRAFAWSPRNPMPNETFTLYYSIYFTVERWWRSTMPVPPPDPDRFETYDFAHKQLSESADE